MNSCSTLASSDFLFMQYYEERIDHITKIDSLDVNFVTFFRKELLSWYHTNRRMLPWRGDNQTLGRNYEDILGSKIFTSPYGTWVSEIMLQQTRVETVIDYWLKWMKRFPTVETLAFASPEEVNQLWAGLGYYRRAQLLLKGAQTIVQSFASEIPSSVNELLKIPGIGPYTAGAISSIAFGKTEPIVDGNVIRVFSRIFALDYEVGTKKMDEACWGLSAKVVDLVDPGNFNQALMELGALVCKPTSPDCSQCPLKSVCAAYCLAQNSENSSSVDIEDSHDGNDINITPFEVTYFPRKAPKKKPRQIILSVGVFFQSEEKADDIEHRYLMVRRPNRGLLANQWEFPNAIMWEENSKEEVVIDSNESNNIPSFSPDELILPFPMYLKENFDIQWIQSEERLGVVDSSSTCMCQDICIISSVLNDQLSKNESFLEEPIIHVFSHQKHIMHISMHQVVELSSPLLSTVQPDEDRALSVGSRYREFRWMTAEEIYKIGITSGCKKILQKVTLEHSKRKLESKGNKTKDIKSPKLINRKKRKASDAK